jgi:hypothetical protein
MRIGGFVTCLGGQKFARARRAGSDASGTAKPNRHLFSVNDDGHGPLAFAEPEHPLEFGGVFLDVHIIERDMPPLIVVPGGSRVGSSVLAEDGDHAANCNGGQTPRRESPTVFAPLGSDPWSCESSTR